MGLHEEMCRHICVRGVAELMSQTLGEGLYGSFGCVIGRITTAIRAISEIGRARKM